MERRTKEELEVLITKLSKQMELFTMELQYESLQAAFRETYEAWYEHRITLDEALDAMMDGMNLCKRIGVWK